MIDGRRTRQHRLTLRDGDEVVTERVEAESGTAATLDAGVEMVDRALHTVITTVELIAAASSSSTRSKLVDVCTVE